MRLVIFGATGAIGTELLEQGLQAGDDVTAVVRNPAKLSKAVAERVRVVRADVMDADAISPAIAEADAVISALGSPGREPSTVITDSARSIITAMRRAPTRRLIVITGSMVDDTGDGPFLRYVGKPMARRIFRGAYDDMVAAEAEVRESMLDWSILRPPKLTDKARSGRYRTALDRNLSRAYSIPRADLATCALAIVGDASTVHHHVFVAS